MLRRFFCICRYIRFIKRNTDFFPKKLEETPHIGNLFRLIFNLHKILLSTPSLRKSSYSGFLLVEFNFANLFRNYLEKISLYYSVHF